MKKNNFKFKGIILTVLVFVSVPCQAMKNNAWDQYGAQLNKNQRDVSHHLIRDISTGEGISYEDLTILNYLVEKKPFLQKDSSSAVKHLTPTLTKYQELVQKVEGETRKGAALYDWYLPKLQQNLTLLEELLANTEAYNFSQLTLLYQQFGPQGGATSLKYSYHELSVPKK